MNKKLPPENPIELPAFKTSFEIALAYIKAGYRAARPSWNAEGKWIYLEAERSEGDPRPNGGRGITHSAYIAMKTSHETVCPWAGSSEDLLANDWTIWTAEYSSWYGSPDLFEEERGDATSAP